MAQLLKRCISYTKDEKHRNRFILIKLACLITAVFIITGLPGKDADAATGLKLYNYATNKTTTYTGKQVLVTCNGTTIGDSSYPGIIVDGIALLPYYDIFDVSRIDADCTYNDKKDTLSISKYGITILMTIGSKKATVNGKAVTLPVAPMKVNYVTSDKTKVLVPSRFVAETLGLGYTWYSDKNTVAIEKYTLQLSYNSGDKFEYTGTQGKVTVNGSSVKLGSTPSLIINNTAMISAYKVFAGTKIGAKYSYNSKTKTLTFQKGSNVLKMTVGSKTAYLNDNSMTMSTAPVYVTNYDSGTSYVLVPGSFTASCLGYNYIWNSKTKTSVITSQKTSSDSSTSSGTDPELGDSGDSGDPFETGTILNQWNATDTQYGSSTGVQNLEPLSGEGSGNITSVSRDYNNTKPNSETFAFTANAPYHKVTSSNNGAFITIQAGNMSCTNQTYPLYGTSSNFVNSINVYNNADSTSSTLQLEMHQDNYQYDISLSSDNLVLYVTVYYNTITSVVLGTNSIGDYLTLSGIDPLKTTVTETSDLIYVDLPYTINSFGDLNTQIQGAKYINQVYLLSSADKTQLILSVNDGYQYYTQESGNQFTIDFQPKSSGQEEDTSTVIDKSKYQIVIPKPADLTSSMITDEDYYLNNYFVICLKGNYSSTITKNTISNTSKTVSGITVNVTDNNNTVIKIATTKLQGYEITSDNQNIYIRVGNPRDIYKNIVVLDPGHGGTAGGALQNGINEKDLNLKILYTLGKKYFDQDTSKLKVYYTRTGDVDMSLKDRAAFASKVGADLFVSLHMNSTDGATTATGTEVFYSHNNNSVSSIGLRSETLASYLVQNLVSDIGTNNRGVKEDVFTVIDKNTVPAVLIELGFLTNKNDFSIITNEAKQEAAAKSIYDTLLQVFKNYPTGR